MWYERDDERYKGVLSVRSGLKIVCKDGGGLEPTTAGHSGSVSKPLGIVNDQTLKKCEST